MSPGRTLKRTSTEDGSVSPPPTKRQQPNKASSSTTQKAVASFFTPASQKQPDPMSWRVVNNTLLVGKYHKAAANPTREVSTKLKVAAFDFDSTLIATQSTRKFAKDAADWRWWAPSVPQNLKNLHSRGYLLAIVSNQAGISLSDTKAKKRLSDFKSKVSAVLSQLDLPVTIYAATEKDQYRKPRTGMWQQLLSDHSLSASSIDLESSLFIGDAAGRSNNPSSQLKDHSSSDRDFAANIGIPFQTPEEYFLQEAPRPFTRKFDPKNYLSTPAQVTGISTDSTPIVFSKKNDLDLVLLVGPPAAGKSTFYWRHLAPLKYVRVNQDLLKTRDKCLKVAGEALANNESVAVDATNADPETRAYWVDLANRSKVPIRVVWLTAGRELCEHNEAVRVGSAALAMGHNAQKAGEDVVEEGTEQEIKFNPEARERLPGIAFGSFFKRFREPTMKEGFDEITKVEFKFAGSEAQKEVWGRYWTS